jgi:hypothetical protein
MTLGSNLKNLSAECAEKMRAEEIQEVGEFSRFFSAGCFLGALSVKKQTNISVGRREGKDE